MVFVGVCGRALVAVVMRVRRVRGSSIGGRTERRPGWRRAGGWWCVGFAAAVCWGFVIA